MAVVADESVEQVLVMFKCHLDVGFTDTAANVVRTYFDVHIPRAVQVADTLRAEGDDRFVWTVPAWLLYKYLQETPGDARAAAERAIERGELAWHGLPFTWYTELLDRSAVAASFGFSAWLDERFGVRTTAARMTDVPGHTKGLVGPLSDAGISFLDIGCNPGCKAPAVPWLPGVGLPVSDADVPDPDQVRPEGAEPAHTDQGLSVEDMRWLSVEGLNSPRTHLFRWREDSGKEVTVLYHPKAYGSTVRLPGVPVVASMRVHNDNAGPHSPESVRATYASLRAKFPNAAVRATNLSEIGAVVDGIRDRLPVLDTEIGDTWIYGSGADPTKSGDLREVLRLRAGWIEDGRLAAGDPTDLALVSDLIPAPEHNWGLSTSQYLRVWDTYRVDELEAARNDEPQHKANEAEWQAQRREPYDAVTRLPEPLRSEAVARLEARRSTAPGAGEPVADARLSNGVVSLRLSPTDGSVTELTDLRTGRQWVAAGGLAAFSYDAYTPEDYRQFGSRYNHATFAANDFGKPGLVNYGVTRRAWTPAGAEISRDGDSLVAALEAPEEARGDDTTAWPGLLVLRYRLHPAAAVLDVEVWAAKKRANRRPEAMWLSFHAQAPDPSGWRLDKLGQLIEPGDVIDDGGRHLHGVQGGMAYKDAAGGLRIETLDAHLVSPGGKGLLQFDNDPIDTRGGMHVALYNNLWGTAFPQWFDQDMYFRFRVALESAEEAGTW